MFSCQSGGYRIATLADRGRGLTKADAIGILAAFTTPEGSMKEIVAR